MYYLDIEINTVERVPVTFRIQIDEATRNKLAKLHVTSVHLIHTIDIKKFPSAKIIAPRVDQLQDLKIDGQ